MNPLKILSEKQKKEIEQKLNGQFGISKIPGKIVMRGGERLFLYSGSLDEKQIKKNIIEIDEKLTEQWMKGSEILFEDIEKSLTIKSSSKGRAIGGGIEKPRGFVVIKYKNEFLGTGKASEEKISNFIPKNRRLKGKN